ncbi:MAG: polyprenyl synthetase family protein [Methanomassiliicoccales archaeon]|nr:polyprenyl synthetase family protein [Methanomassiliicoccales archaeon]NYT16145.1 polyprenyl synthetase family protein [Methanomassiliicoccales archaeon]
MKYLEDGKPEKLVRAVRHYPEAGGKRLRPVLAMLVADAISGKEEESIPFGCCLEIIHNFTLIHDDVMDEDPMRRGRPAVHVLYDVPTAIIAGDAMFARGFEVLAMVEVAPEKTRRLLSLVAKTVWIIAEGQQMDIDFENSNSVTVDEYLEMIEKKTAILFACAAQGATMIADGSEDQERDMFEYARLLGLGFQIWDDVLGITADEKKLGKPVGSDIRNGKRTLVVIHALENADEEDRQSILSILGHEDATDEEVAEVIETLERIGSIEFAKSRAIDYAKQAKKCLEGLPDSDSKVLLDALLDYSVKREL